MIEYLEWYKDLEVNLAGRPDVHLLLSSSIVEPTDLLMRDLHAFTENGARASLSKTNARGHPEMLEAVSKRYGCDTNRIVATNGASNGIHLLCKTLLESGDRIVIESPCYESLRSTAEDIGCEIVSLNRMPPEYRIDLEQLSDLLNERTKLVLLTNLHNPSGSYMEDDTLREIGEIVKHKSDAFVAVDEIYKDFVTEDNLQAFILGERFISIASLTKAHGLGSIHTGWIISTEEISQRILQLQTLVEGSGSRLVEGLSAVIVNHLDDYISRAIEVASFNREVLQDRLSDLIQEGIFVGDVPEYGCIWFPRLNLPMSTEECVKRLSTDYGVYVVPGRYLGLPEHIRIGFGSAPVRLENAVDALLRAFSELI